MTTTNRIHPVCTVEDDGFHTHEYRIYHGIRYACTITVHLHTWTADHLERHPGAKPVDATIGTPRLGDYEVIGKYDTLTEAWADYGDGDIPAVDCQARPALTGEQYDAAYRLWETNPHVTAPTPAMCQIYAVEQGGTFEQARQVLYHVYGALPAAS